MVNYAGSAQPTTLSVALAAAGTSFTVVNATGWPAGQFVALIDRDTAAAEKILCTRSGTTFTVVTRGYDGTPASAHASGASVVHPVDATSLQRHEDSVLLQPTRDAARFSQAALQGGGVLLTESGDIRWTYRFIAIGTGKGAHWATGGYHYIDPPAPGTVITGAFGAASVTVNASGGIPLSGYRALYAVTVIGGGSSEVTYRIVDYAIASEQVIPPHWIFIASRNSETPDGRVKWGTGVITDYWRTLSLVNSWTRYSLDFPDAQFLKGHDGFVHLRGLVKSGASGSVMGTLPVGYRPEWPIHALFSAAGNTGQYRIGGAKENNGPVQQPGAISLNNLGGSATTWSDLAGFTPFQAEA